MIVALDKGFASFCTIHALHEIAPLHRSVGCRFGFWVFLFLGLGLVWLWVFGFRVFSGLFVLLRGCLVASVCSPLALLCVVWSNDPGNTVIHNATLEMTFELAAYFFQLCWPSPDPNGRLGAGWMSNCGTNNKKIRK